MKFMKLGSKPDTFQTDENNVRYVANELAADIIINVGDAKFCLHKFPLLSRSAHLQKLAASTEVTSDEIYISDIPGGPSAFEICAKFCYGMIVTLNAYNVVMARCAAEYLGMHETIEKGNLIYKIDVFLSSSIFRSWKDSIIVLETTNAIFPFSEEPKFVGQCIESIASKACIDVSKVDWSYSYNRKKVPEENDNDPKCNGIRNRSVTKDWWVEDLCELEIDLYKRVLVSIKAKGILASEVIGEALKVYSYRRLPDFSKDMRHSGDVLKYLPMVDSIVWLLPAEKGSVSCSFLLKLLKAATFVDSGNIVKEELVRRIGQQLEEASVNDLLLPTTEGETMMYDVTTVQMIVEEFLRQDKNAEMELVEDDNKLQMIRPGILLDASKLMVAKLMDGYLAEIAKDSNLPVTNFLDLANAASCISRPAHDAIYRAIDMYLKEHPGISKSEKKKICKLMDCKLLSVDACMHAVQNERLPMRVVVQILFFEQMRVSASSGSSTPDLPKNMNINSASNGSSKSATTNTEEDWDAVATTEEIKSLKRGLASLRLSNGVGVSDSNDGNSKSVVDKAAISKMRGILKSKRIFTKLWSSKGGQGDNSGSDSSESLGSANPDEAKSTPSRNRRYSVS